MPASSLAFTVQSEAVEDRHHSSGRSLIFFDWIRPLASAKPVSYRDQLAQACIRSRGFFRNVMIRSRQGSMLIFLWHVLLNEIGRPGGMDRLPFRVYPRGWVP